MHQAEQGTRSEGGSGTSAGQGSSASRSGGQEGSEGERSYVLGLARGFGAAIIFSLPMLMTMEYWWLGFYGDRLRLAVFAFLMFPLLFVLGFFIGFRRTSSFAVELVDAATAYGIGLVAATTVLSLIGMVTFGMAPREIIGKIVLLGIVASFGSMLGRSQLGSQRGKQQEEKKRKETGWTGEMVFMLAGAMYLALNLAPTVEMIKIPYHMTPWHAIALLAASIALMHAFVYAMEFKGASPESGRAPWWSLFLRYTIPGYVIATGVAAYLLWTFGRFENFDLYWVLLYSIVLGFPASVGAAAARLIF